ncbi:helix-turn-helix transcriptional regulator [Ruminiclostridium cellobioparum]|uniref:Helix-turn-helix protein n=1 Tax=Ruminiclostridium cellobioparum subsp. termitidis CT1112 TaxID=1195236 RepID=S0FT07_RUMCE|nr:helix-turn-helix transcriptional regulator [Ruminiclostridium cellobioparum]EMS72304.1 helix-turn-helix protein [Ruminiclostridium cellobioparum subsp. termitidis CT1112]
MTISLVNARNKKGKTQAEMAGILGIALSTYNMYENGQRKIPENIATKICEVLESKKEDIFLAATFTLRETSKNF